ncbi:MAG: DUF3179 domain-containing protein [Acidobacteria bacterium]|nr:DUF3179 domain-containing protein [Acidobacteriota bacterium]
MAQHVANLRRSARPMSATLRDDPRLPPMTQVLGVETGGGRKAYPMTALEKHAVVNDQVGSTAVLLVHNAAKETTTVFARTARGRALTFRAAAPGTAQVTDAETRSTWTSYGACVGGPLKGERLEPITPLPSFWFWLTWNVSNLPSEPTNRVMSNVGFPVPPLDCAAVSMADGAKATKPASVSRVSIHLAVTRRVEPSFDLILSPSRRPGRGRDRRLHVRRQPGPR